jgi:glycosyltransferase involved in cell wall biosynthesis
MPLTVLSVSYPLAPVSVRTAGGAEQVLAMLDAALVRAGHRSLVLAAAGSRASGLLIRAQVPTGVLDDKAKATARCEFKKQLERALETYSVDLVHMHGLDFPEYMPEHQIPVMVTLHLPLSWYAPHALGLARTRLTLVCVSKFQASTRPVGVTIDKVIPNGIDLGRFHARPNRSDYALVIGRICPEKGIHLAIEAAERAGTELLIAGTVFDYPEHREYFESMIRPRLNCRIRFIGPVGGSAKADLLAGARCLLIPSLAPETSSLVAMEAMAAGTPVVAFQNGALAEVVEPGVSGFLVPDAERMAEGIREVGSINTNACRREAERRFSAERMFAEYVELYRSVLSREHTSELKAA